MIPLTRSDLSDLTQYELERPDFHRAMIERKRWRRVAVGPEVTFVFENRDTVRFQVQEMLRVERIVKPEAIQAELDVYNELIPGDHELSATMLIEITQSSRIRETLDRLIGIDEHVVLDVGGREVPARFDPKQFEEDRISAVQYVRFPLGEDGAAAFRDTSVPVTLRIEHPHYRHETSIEGPVRDALRADLDAT